MFCSECGKKIKETENYCGNCGTSKTILEGSTFGWGVVGFLVPLAGLILFIMWKDTRPNSSKSAGIGALISVALGLVTTIIYFMILFAFFIPYFSNVTIS